MTRWTWGILAAFVCACVPETNPPAPDAGTAADAGPDAGSETGAPAVNLWLPSGGGRPGSLIAGKITLQNAGAETWNLSVAGLPTGVTATFDSPTLATGRDSAILTLDVADDAAVPQTTQLTVTAKSPTRQVTTEPALVYLSLGRDDDPPGYVIQAQRTGYEGDAAHAVEIHTVRVLPVGPITGDVWLSASGVRPDLATFDPPKVTLTPGKPARATLRIRMSPLDPPVGVLIRGTAGRASVLGEWMLQPTVEAPATPSEWLAIRSSRAVVPAGSHRALSLEWGGATIGTPEFHVDSAPAGITVEAGALDVAKHLVPITVTTGGNVVPGVYAVTVSLSAFGVRGEGTIRVVVPEGPVWASTFVPAIELPAARAGRVTSLSLSPQGDGKLDVLASTGLGTARAPEGADFVARDESDATPMVESVAGAAVVRASVQRGSLSLVDQQNGVARSWNDIAAGITVLSCVAGAPSQAFSWCAAATNAGAKTWMNGSNTPPFRDIPWGLPYPMPLEAKPQLARRGLWPSLLLQWADTFGVWTARYSTTNPGLPEWIQQPAIPGAALPPVRESQRSAAMDLDAQERPVVAWVGTDEALHLARLEGNAWVDVPAPAVTAGKVVRELAFRVGADGRMLLAWVEAAHTVLFDGPVSRFLAPESRLRVAELADGSWVEWPVPTADPEAFLALPMIAIDAQGRRAIGWTADGEAWAGRTLR